MQIKDMTMTDMVTLVLDKKQLKKDLKNLNPGVCAEVRR
jgi:hypothetical protein